MRCSTYFCGNAADYINTNSRVKKCRSCFDKRLDKYTSTWRSLYPAAQESESLQYEEISPAPQSPGPYSYLINNDYSFSIVHSSNKEKSLLIVSSEECARAIDVCSLLNNAYKLGISETLHSLVKFSIDKRREESIVWGSGDFASY